MEDKAPFPLHDWGFRRDQMEELQAFSVAGSFALQQTSIFRVQQLQFAVARMGGYQRDTIWKTSLVVVHSGKKQTCNPNVCASAAPLSYSGVRARKSGAQGRACPQPKAALPQRRPPYGARERAATRRG